MHRSHRLFAALWLTPLLSTAPAWLFAQPTCASGRIVADFGYEFISCVDCLALTRVVDVEYVTFRGEPVLHRIRADGPGAGKLLDNDTLVAVNGRSIRSLDAARLLSDWNPVPVTLTLRRNGALRTESLQPTRVCVPNNRRAEPRIAPRVVAERAVLGVAMRCDRCRVMRLGAESEAWVYQTPPEVARLVPGGPAHRAGVQVGDTLVAVNGVSVASRAGGELLSSVRPGEKMEWTLRRGGHTITVTLVPGRSGE
jgi:hypothetical protein